jgi:hypothetical protein
MKKHWIPGRARNDKTAAYEHSFGFEIVKKKKANEITKR